MAAEIKLIKADESPWGFRLTGGRDFGTPLTIIKVAINSVAEQAGLKVGDILVRINDVSGHSLSHRDAQDVIKKSGNSITFSVLRGNLNIPEEVIERLTPLPLQEFISQTPEPNAQLQQQQQQQLLPNAQARLPVIDPNIQIIPIKDLEPEQLAELGLNPLPSDFLEKALRNPTPLPEVRPNLTSSTPIPDILETLDQLGLQDVVQDIEKQREAELIQIAQAQAQAQAQAKAQAQAQPQGPVEGQAGGKANEIPSAEAAPQAENPQGTPAPEQTQQPTEQQAPEQLEPAPPPEFLTNQPITEDTFEEIMSGKAELIDGTNAMGVDFKKFEPQANFLKKSQVFQSLQEEQQQQQQQQQPGEKNKEKEKRWTTFLEKPDRPKLKPKQKPKASKTQNKAETLKGQEPEASPTPTPTPEPGQAQGLYEIPPQEEFEALVKLPEPAQESGTQPEEPQPNEQEQPNQQEGQMETEPETEGPIQETCPEEVTPEEHELVQQQQVLEKQLSTEITVEEKSDIELQLEEIQKQLEAIRQLPFEIQQHLSMVQDQLMKIVQHRNQEQVEKVPPAPRPSIAEPEMTAPLKQEETTPEGTQEKPTEEQQLEQSDQPQQTESQPASEQPQNEQTEQPQEEQSELKQNQEEEEAVLPPPKIEKPKKKRPFMGLGPAPRPLILPGGRKWRTPKDAYNDEFIAETLSAQAEIITGSTLGVNFRKYEPKHPTLDHLRDSIVYKMIHDLEDPDIVRGGLADRPEIVPALQDYVQPATPAAI